MKTFSKIIHLSICKRAFSILAFFSLFLSIQMKAQENSQHKKRRQIPLIYGEASIGYSNGVYGSIGHNLILANQWGIHIGYMNGHKTPKSLPMPNDPSYNSSNTPNLHNKFSSYSFRVSRSMLLNNPSFRMKAEMGIAFLKYETANIHTNPNFGQTPILSWIFGEDSPYSVRYTLDHSIGLSTRVLAEFPIIQGIGMQMAVMGTITEKHSFFGIEFGLCIGHVRNENVKTVAKP